MLDGLDRRRLTDEWMDAPDADPEQLRRSLGYLRAVNRALGYNRAVLGYFSRFRQGWPAGGWIDVLDVACGSADLGRDLIRWGRRRGVELRVVGLDRHERTAAMATSAGSMDRLQIVRGDALRLPFGDGAVDYAVCGTFLHHLDTADAVAALAEMGRVSRRGVVVADLVRGRRAAAWFAVLSAFANPMVKHDGRASIRQAFAVAEADELRSAAGLGWARVRRHFGHRFILAGEKPRASG